MNSTMKKLVATWAVPALALSLSANLARADGVASAGISQLCQPSEAVVFSCPVKGQRTVSICASKPLTATEGYLQYRFGKGEKSEIALPKDASGSANWRKEVAGRSLMFAGGGGAYLRFANQSFSYVVYTAIGRGWGEKQGLFVLKDGQMISNLKCTGKHQSQMGLALFEQAGIAEDSEELELP
jgi:hypothetical protein